MIKKIIILSAVWVFFGCSTNVKYNDIGYKYLGVKYVDNPLGENQQPDTDPLIRTDAFDCTTFVETVLAGEDEKKLTDIRYKNGDVNFINRNHFIECDWLYNNKNIVENVSGLYGKTAIRSVNIDKKRWFKRIYNIDVDIKPIMVNIEYIPYSNFDISTIKDVLIVLFISGNSNFYDKIGTDLAVVHMGFLFPNGVLRHASSKKGMVVDTDIRMYIKNLQQNKNNLGVALVKIK